ncbi:unnamed protein product [Toxocara canis]|uniref:TOG domain-containing protein n=1 Tax=Toxocara canis TaxID=6265 RepID=A0A183TXJ7_TOXCA|nr:unnamed protein product [Toxocara canis]
MQPTRGSVLGGVENAPTTPAYSRASSVPANKRPQIAVTAKNSGEAGAISDEAFQEAFTHVRKCSLKNLRALIICGGLDFSDFAEEVRLLENPFLLSIKDLRSQVCREACVTFAFYCERLGQRMAHILVAIIPVLINLLQNSAKVMATSGLVALRYAVKYVRSEKLLVHLHTAMTSKSREIRRYSASLLLMALTLWEGRIVEKNMPTFLDCIKMSINDADLETRNTGRAMYVQLDQEYKQQADILYRSLDPSKQRQLSGFLSQSSSSQSLISEKDSLPMSQRSSYALNKGSFFFFLTTPAYYCGRSTSDIDPKAARRATHSNNKWGGPLHQVNGTANAGSRSTSPSTRHPASRLPPRTLATTAGRMRSQTEDLEDGASASADSLRFETAELTNALAYCASTLVSDRKEGLKALFTIIASDHQINPIDLKKIVERLNVLIGEGSHKVCS